MSENEQESEKRVTIADILAEMFDFSDKRIEEGRDHAMTSESVGLIVHQLAKRLEAAWKRESAGNAAAMRDAAERLSALVGNWIDHLPPVVRQEVSDLIDELDAALSAPARNCDVGTAEEQAERFKRFCSKHHEEWKNGKPLMAWTCDCPCYQTSENSCNRLAWAQMPYEDEEGAGK